MKRCLYWVTKDLRINDNLALNLARQSEQLICVFVVDKKWFETNHYQSKPLGVNRWHFLQRCLSDFNDSLLKLGQQLHIVYGDTLTSLSSLCAQYDITNVITTRLPGTDENRLINQLSDDFAHISINKVEQFTLFTQHSLPFEVQDLPISYSKFRKVMAAINRPKLIDLPQSLPAMFASPPTTTVVRPQWALTMDYREVKHGVYFDGGEVAALKHLHHYFSSALPANYKQVRNNLEGWENSSKLSPWLAYGCISPRQVMCSIEEFEAQQEKNSSTECLALEILWREYFQWVHVKIGAKMYQFKGVAERPPLTSFYPERFIKWCLGNTPYPLVNACMNELRKTGYLSNRGRQIVASCLVNELSIDWRFGAAWFEEHLIDYDAAVNWGNWQYIAGVGADPRGGRHFNIIKQTAQYDPDAQYQKKWITQNEQANPILDSFDASDWPIEQ